jgi:hypothetical protein
MNNTLGIEYAYTRIHKLEVEALAYKDKIAELEKGKAFLLTQRFMGNTIVSTEQGLSDAINAHNLEQQAKGADDFYDYLENIENMYIPSDYISEFKEILSKQAKGGAE